MRSIAGAHRKGLDELTDATGRRRLDDPQDFVCMEVAKALAQQVRVIPVLVKGAKMPAPEDLPEALRPVTRRQALELRHNRWNQDVEQLASALAELLGLQWLDRQTSSPPPPPEEPARKSGNLKMLSLAAAVAVAILAVAGYSLFSEEPVPTPVILPELKDDGVVVEPEVTVKPQALKTINLTGLWVDEEGINVQITQQGDEVVSQYYNPLTGLAINSAWRVSGRRMAFNWVSNAGNQGQGEGTIAADGATVEYRFVDNVTGEQGYGRIFRVIQ